MVRYRKSKNIGPFRITLTQKGVSTSVVHAPSAPMTSSPTSYMAPVYQGIRRRTRNPTLHS